MRDNKMDNIRFGLIFLVVLGHFLESSTSGKLGLVNEFIYSFHMPVFVFISGYFAKFNVQRITRTYLYSYTLMQIIYCFFLKYYMGSTQLTFQLSVPHYTLWYLLAMALYTMIIPIIQTESREKKLFVIALSFGLSLLAGADPKIGYPFAAGRFFGFLPFFVLGFYCRTSTLTQKLKELSFTVRAFLGAAICAVLAAAELFIMKSSLITIGDMNCINTYSNTQWGWKARVVLLGAGLLWTAFLLVITPSKKIPLVSKIGANTFPIYILHGLLIKILVKGGITQLSGGVYAVVAVSLSLVVLVIFGNEIASNIAKWGLTGQWIGAVEKRTKK